MKTPDKESLDFWHKTLGIIASSIKIITAITVVSGMIFGWLYLNNDRTEVNGIVNKTSINLPDAKEPATNSQEISNNYTIIQKGDNEASNLFQNSPLSKVPLVRGIQTESEDCDKRLGIARTLINDGNIYTARKHLEIAYSVCQGSKTSDVIALIESIKEKTDD